ncbi:hypothetical protein [Frankia tisae]|uniref:hypothetical protein n=1 Tax=Frankia tisae TaxID=2950104 RepID=UPI0021BEF583|nr:hypothetical protein [Frankia tisae]
MALDAISIKTSPISVEQVREGGHWWIDRGFWVGPVFTGPDGSDKWCWAEKDGGPGYVACGDHSEWDAYIDECAAARPYGKVYNGIDLPTHENGLVVLDLERNHAADEDGVTAWEEYSARKGINPPPTPFDVPSRRGGAHRVWRQDTTVRNLEIPSAILGEGMEVIGDSQNAAIKVWPTAGYTRPEIDSIDDLPMFGFEQTIRLQHHPKLEGKVPLSRKEERTSTPLPDDWNPGHMPRDARQYVRAQVEALLSVSEGSRDDAKASLLYRPVRLCVAYGELDWLLEEVLLPVYDIWDDRAEAKIREYVNRTAEAPLAEEDLWKRRERGWGADDSDKAETGESRLPEPMKDARLGKENFDRAGSRTVERDDEYWARRMDEFWESSPQLRHVAKLADANEASRWGVLAAMLAEAVSQVDPCFVLPRALGGRASLNLDVAIVGPTGSSKNKSINTAFDGLEVVGGEPTYRRELGSGEGIVAMFVEVVPAKGEQPTRMRPLRTRAVSTIGEIRTLQAQAGRQGSILVPTILSMNMGEPAGGAYKTKGLDLALPAHSYRYCIIATSQTKKMGIMLREGDSGLPQRFWNVPATKPRIDDPPEWPGPLQWKPASEYLEGSNPWVEIPVGEDDDGSPITIMDLREPELIEVPVPAWVVQEVREENRKRDLGMWVDAEVDEIESHATLLRTKLANALSVLEGRYGIEDQDWARSEVMTYVNWRTLDYAQSSIAVHAREEAIQSEITKQMVEEEAKTGVRRKKMDAVLRYVKPDWQTRSKVRTAARRQRHDFDDVIGWLKEAGEIEVRSLGNSDYEVRLA